MASGLSIGDYYCSALSVHGVNRAFDDCHWGVPKFSIGLKSGLTSGQGFTFASLCSRKSLVNFAVCTQVLSCLISGFGVGGKRWHKKRLKNIVDILGSYYTIASTWTNMLKHIEVKLNSPMECCLVLPRNPFFLYNHRTPFFYTIIEIALSLFALNSLLVWKTDIRNLRWYSATCHADNSVEL